MKMKMVLFALLVSVSMAFAATTITGSLGSISTLIQSICSTLQSLVPVIAITLVILAGVAYGIGNFFGAETKAKAQGWGMAALTGAIIMLVIYIIGPTIINALYGSQNISCSGTI